MGRPHIVRYHWYKNQQPPLVTRSEFRDTPGIHQSYRAFEIRLVGYVIVYDISGSSYCEERECLLYEISTSIFVKHEDQNNRAVRSSRVTKVYGFLAENLSARILPENFEYICETCHTEPGFNRICEYCQEDKLPFVLVTDCFTRPQILDALSPQTYHVDAHFGTRPYAEELFAATLHPNRKDLWDSVLDVEDARDLKNGFAEEPLGAEGSRTAVP